MGKDCKKDFTIIADTREQKPLTPLLLGMGYSVETGTLSTGDYSIQGFESVIAVERKSVSDLVGCMMGKNRQRFERELARGCGLERFCVVVESPFSDIESGNYRSNINPRSVVNSVKSFEWRYRCRFYFCENREAAAKTVASLLGLFVYDHERGKRCGVMLSKPEQQCDLMPNW